MRERIRPTRSGLFAIELVAAVGVFTLCAAVCLGVFVQSEVMSQDSAALVRAVNEARSAAECFKAAEGALDRTAALFGGQVQPDGGAEALVQTYDQDWNRVSGGAPPSPAEDGIFYQLLLTPGSQTGPEAFQPEEDIPGCTTAWLRVVRNDGQSVLSWEIAAWEAAS